MCKVKIWNVIFNVIIYQNISNVDENLNLKINHFCINKMKKWNFDQTFSSIFTTVENLWFFNKKKYFDMFDKLIPKRWLEVDYALREMKYRCKYSSF